MFVVVGCCCCLASAVLDAAAAAAAACADFKSKLLLIFDKVTGLTFVLADVGIMIILLLTLLLVVGVFAPAGKLLPAARFVKLIAADAAAGELSGAGIICTFCIAMR